MLQIETPCWLIEAITYCLGKYRHGKSSNEMGFPICDGDIIF